MPHAPAYLVHFARLPPGALGFRPLVQQDLHLAIYHLDRLTRPTAPLKEPLITYPTFALNDDDTLNTVYT